MDKRLVILLCLLVGFLAYMFWSGIQLEAHQIPILKHLFQVALIVAAVCFFVSEITRNFGQVDKIWSIIPIFYVGAVAYFSHWDLRILIMFVLCLLWGIRLTYNFARKGGYHLIPWKGEEDYRWEYLRKSPGLNNRLGWTIFNLGFISLYQNILILLFTLPALAANSTQAKPLHVWDYIAILGFVILLIIQTRADNQMFNFQEEKKRKIAAGETLEGEYAKGFISTGWWRCMRHPNYMAEQGMWICFYLFSVAATGQWINWSLLGVLLLLILFKGSSDFSEKITASKYPEYKEYQKTVGRFLPNL